MKDLKEYINESLLFNQETWNAIILLFVSCGGALALHYTDFLNRNAKETFKAIKKDYDKIKDDSRVEKIQKRLQNDEDVQTALKHVKNEEEWNKALNAILTDDEKKYMQKLSKEQCTKNPSLMQKIKNFLKK